MLLRDYIQSQGLTIAAWAARHGRHRNTVGRHASGKRIPSSEEMAYYYVVTMGAVTPSDFYDLPSLPDEMASRMRPCATSISRHEGK